jgi:hypothetical protein
MTDNDSRCGCVRRRGGALPCPNPACGLGVPGEFLDVPSLDGLYRRERRSDGWGWVRVGGSAHPLPQRPWYFGPEAPLFETDRG